jgi:hypothetical protein
MEVITGLPGVESRKVEVLKLKVAKGDFSSYYKCSLEIIVTSTRHFVMIGEAQGTTKWMRSPIPSYIHIGTATHAHKLLQPCISPRHPLEDGFVTPLGWDLHC